MKKISLFFVCILLFAFSACSDVVPIWTDSKTLNQNCLNHTEPEELLFTMKDAGNFRLEMVLEYYTQISRSSLPLFIVFENLDNHQIQEFKADILLKKEGKWEGQPSGYGTDYTLTCNPVSKVKLMRGKYRLRIYSNDKTTEKIYGIVRMETRLFDR
ncbi:MAG: hypothetical protein ACKVTZ_09360 [Bacteroidia bacterium]